MKYLLFMPLLWCLLGCGGEPKRDYQAEHYQFIQEDIRQKNAAAAKAAHDRQWGDPFRIPTFQEQQEAARIRQEAADRQRLINAVEQSKYR